MTIPSPPDASASEAKSGFLRFARLGRRADRLFFAVALVWTLFGAAAALAGGILWHLGPLTIRAQRPLRTLAIGCALLLLREGWRARTGRLARLRGLALLLVVLSALAGDSRPRIVGDGQEYLAMAWNLAGGRPAALSAAERARFESAFALQAGELSLGREMLVGPDGRQDFHHFWLYSLFAAPLLAGVVVCSGPVLLAFTILNVALTLWAAWIVHRHAGGVMLVLFGGPLLWWIDKPHPESMLVALLAAALALAPRQPERALPLVGLAAAQNPVFTGVLAIGSLWALLRHNGRRWLLPALAGAWAIALSNPLYFLRHLGRAVPLRDTVLAHVPSLKELWAVLGDPNLGLLPAWPALGIAAAVGFGVVLGRVRQARLGRELLDLCAISLAVAVLLCVFTQPGNINHGGTRGMSRYALWLAPFALPALAVWAPAREKMARVGMSVLAALSLLSLFPEYLPSRPERYLEPTPLAEWLWTRHPELDHPLPEVFAERAWGYPPLGSVPASTPRCEKALVQGDGTALGRWPLACRPGEKPEPCREVGTLCYVDTLGARYRFERAPAQPTFPALPMTRWYWSGEPGEALAASLRELPWKEFGIVAPEDETAFFRDRSGTGRIELRTAPGVFLAWFDGVRREGAWLIPIVPRAATAIVVDPLTGAELSRTRVVPGALVRIPLPLRAPLLLLVSAGL